MPKPAWTDEQKLPSFPSMKRNLDVDVAVVGGGITGLTTAYLLKQSGLKVVVLEKGSLGQGEISHTTAHLTYVTDHRLNELVDDVGQEEAKATWDAGRTAIDQIEQIVRELKIDCEFERVPGYLHAPWTSNDVDLTSLERDARYAKELGFAAELVDDAPFVNAPAVRFDNQAKFHPYKYLDGLAKAIAGDGSFIFEDTEVEEITDDLICRVGKYRVQGKLVVIATHVPLMGKTNLLKATIFQSKLSLYSTYALGARVPKGTIPKALFWDTSDPYYYLRVDEHEDHDFIVFGGCDHKTGQAADTNAVYKKLEGLLSMIAPRANVTHRWSGQVVETLDGLPYIGETAKGQFVATGFCGNGITFGTAAGLMAVDLAHGRKNAWADLFSPRRKALQHPVEYMRENKDYPYYMVKDWLHKAEDLAPEEIPPGEGHILSIDGHKTAVARDDDGRLSACSAVCTHMGCVVHWNQAEKTWDCPCHGSRFAPGGEVIAGPAETPLEKQKLPETARHD